VTSFGPVDIHWRFGEACCLHTSILCQSVTPWNLVNTHKYFGEICCLCLHGKGLRHQVFFFSKHCSLYARRRGFSFQKSVMLIFTAMLTWNLNINLAFHTADICFGLRRGGWFSLPYTKKESQNTDSCRTKCEKLWIPSMLQEMAGPWVRRNSAKLTAICWIHVPLVLLLKHCSAVMFSSAL
jgi:hypothetical protein